MPLASNRCGSCRDGAGRRGNDVRPNEPFEAGHVALLGGADDSIDETPLLGRTSGRATVVGNMLPSAGHDLTSVGFLEPKNVRDLASSSGLSGYVRAKCAGDDTTFTTRPQLRLQVQRARNSTAAFCRGSSRGVSSCESQRATQGGATHVLNAVREPIAQQGFRRACKTGR